MQIQCPHCQKTLDAPSEKAGQVTNCPACGGQMQLPAAGAPAPAPSQPSQQAGSAPPGGGATKVCRFCGEDILAVAQKCKHCGSYLSGPRAGGRGRAGSASSSSQGTTALVLGIVGILTACFPIVPLVLGGVAIHFARRARAEGDESGTATAGLVVGIVATVFGVLSCLYWVLVAVVAIAQNV